MPETTTTTADAGGRTGDAGASSVQGTADAGQAKQGATGDQPHYSHKEFVEYAKRVQRLEDEQKQRAAVVETKVEKRDKAEKPEVPSEVAQLRQELALKDAALEHGLTKEQRQRLDRLFKAEQPRDVEDWVGKTVAEMGWKKDPDATKTTTKVDPTKPKVRTDLGAAGRSEGGQLPEDVTAIDPATWKSLTPQERREILNKAGEKSGRNGVFWKKPIPK